MRTALPRRSGSSRPAGAGLKRAVAQRARRAVGPPQASFPTGGRLETTAGRLGRRFPDQGRGPEKPKVSLVYLLTVGNYW
jgi:hypothetical protein